jgi:hypothetical protein
MAFGVVEITYGGLPFIFEVTDGNSLLPQCGVNRDDVVDLPRQGNPLTRYTLNARSAFIGDAEKHVGSNFELDKPIVLVVDGKLENVSIKADGLGPVLTIQDGVGSVNFDGHHQSLHLQQQISDDTAVGL